MLYGMNGTIVQTGFLVGNLHADVEGGYCFSAYLVFAADVDAAEQFVVIDSETGYLVHFFLMFGI